VSAWWTGNGDWQAVEQQTANAESAAGCGLQAAAERATLQPERATASGNWQDPNRQVVSRNKQR
jgi:hypothetical protein